MGARGEDLTMNNYKFLYLLLLLPIAGLSIGLAWATCKWLARLYRKTRNWLHYRKHKAYYKQKVEPKL